MELQRARIVESSDAQLTVEKKKWIREHIANVHNPPAGFQTCVTVGSTDAFAKIVTLLGGDSVMYDKYAYAAATATSEALGRVSIGVDMDDEGMTPAALIQQVTLARKRGLHPDIVYLVPVAQNPTGVTMSANRKRELYQTCSELDLIIVEDGTSIRLYTLVIN
jgi:aromatic amino acid aminotransferase I